jgi:heat shock protein HslJ
MGYSGCNRMRGSIFWEPGLLRFTNIASTRMACRPENKEAVFLKNLESATTYRIENNRLWLSNPYGSLLIFKKVD